MSDPTSTRPCRHGCTIRGSHRATCTGRCACPGKHRRDCDGECRGCLPKHTETPAWTLCDRCHLTTKDAIEDAPEIVERLVVLGRPTAAARALTDDPINRRDPAEGSALPAQWLDADEPLSLLHSWADVTALNHPTRPVPPERAGWDATVAGWLLDRLDFVMRQDFAVDVRREVPTLVRSLDYRWPGPVSVEAQRRIVDVPCPRCDLMGTLLYTPPSWPRQAFRVECVNVDCARVFSEEEWERFQALALRVRPVKTLA